MLKKLLVVSILLILSIGVVSASDNLTQMDGDNILASPNDSNSFADLQNIINNAKNGDTINLDKSYSYSKNDPKDGILINKSITINGNGMVLDARNSSRIFIIDNNVDYDIEDNVDYDMDDAESMDFVVLKNLVFKNGNAKNGGAIFINDTVYELFFKYY